MQQQAALSRIHRSWLAHHERQTLTWLAARLPAWITSDHLTLLGLAGALLCGLSYAACLLWPHMLWFACLGLVLNWFGDSLDGSLARFRGIERPRYGFFIDHSADVVSQLFIFLGLGLSPYMRFDMACLALLSYWLAALYTFIRAVATQVFQISYFGIGPTEIRLSLLAYSLALLVVDPFILTTPIGKFAPIDSFVLVTFFAVFAMFLLAVYGESCRLAALEPLPRRVAVRERAG
jgi:archaetidylinositol phosphate synthase